MRLKELRKEKGISLKELGQILGVAESTVSLYESGKREASYTILHKLSEFFGVSIEYLLGDKDEKNGTIPYLITIPILESVYLSEGEFEFNYSVEKEKIEIGSPENYFYYKMHDESMSPQISKDDICLIKKVDHIESGDIAAVVYGENPVMLRRVIRNKNATVLQAFNHSFESIIVSDDDRVLILGALKQTIKKW